MVCQKSRKRGATKKTTKGKTTTSGDVSQQGDMPAPLTKESLATLPTSEPNQQTRTVSLNSGDDSVSTSSGSSVQAPVAAAAPLSPWVPKDPKLVAETLRAREEREKITVAKSMLYQAYLNALRG
jgi:hypothetical protein